MVVRLLPAAGFVSLIAQMPGGALVDTAKSERLVAGIAVAVICLSALAYAVHPIFPVVLGAAVIDFGGFLGVGSRKIAVDWGALHFPPPGKPGARIALDLNRDQVNAAPEYQEGKPVVVLGALGKLEPLPE